MSGCAWGCGTLGVPLRFCVSPCLRPAEALLVSVFTVSLGLAGGCDELRATDWASLRRRGARGGLPWVSAPHIPCSRALRAGAAGG